MNTEYKPPKETTLASLTVMEIDNLLYYPKSIMDIACPADDIKSFLIQNNPTNVQYISVLNEKLCLEAIELDPTVMKYIHSAFLTRRVINQALTLDGLLLGNITNPTHEMLELAVEQNGLAIKFINNPTDIVIQKALRSTGDAIQYIFNPTGEYKNIAVTTTPTAIQFIRLPTRDMQIKAVSKDVTAISYIGHIVPEVFDIAVSKDSKYFKYYYSQTLNTVLSYLRKDGLLIRFIKEPSELEINTAMQQNSNARRFINRPKSTDKETSPIVNT